MNYDEIIRKQMKNYLDTEDTDALSDYAGKLTDGLSDSFTLDKILSATLKGESIFDDGQLIEDLKTLFLYEIRSAMMIGAEIITVCIIIGLIKNLSSSFGKSAVNQIAGLICAMVIVGLAMTNFYDIYNLTISSVKTITYTMEVLLPVLIALIIAMGRVASGTIMSPLLLAAITAFQSVIKNIILPLVFVSTVLTMVNCLTEKDYVNQLSKFLRRAALFACGLIITLMTGIITVQGIIVKSTDSLLMDTARYSLDNFIPIVGGFASDTIDLFLKCMGSIKNVVGVFGIITIVLLMLSPIIKIVAVALVYKIIGLLTEAVAPPKLSSGISDIGSSLITMGAVLFFSSLLFIIFITCIINLGGG